MKKIEDRINSLSSYLFILNAKSSSQKFSTEYNNKLMNNKALIRAVDLTEELKKEIKDFLSEDKLIGVSCFDYVILKSMGLKTMMLAINTDIKVDKENKTISFLTENGYSFCDYARKGDIAVFFDHNGKAIHFGLMSDGKLMSSKIGYWAKSIFIHNIDAVKEEYGDNVRYMTKASVDSDDDQQTPSFFSYYCHIL